MKFLVTGGAGFIGSNIVERLLKDGHFVRVLDNFSTGKRENLLFTRGLFPKQKGLSPSELIHREPQGTVPFELIEGDIRDKETCDTACCDMDFVLHQAALRSVPGSLKDPDSYNEVNIQGTLNMLQAAAKHKAKRFVFASTSAIYGDTNKFPEQETDYPLLISPYALSKLAGEYYCKIFSEYFNLETVCLRYFNVFGPRQPLDDEYAVVIPKFINCILNDEQPPIFGTGKQSRDFVYIDNVVEANILAATKVRVPKGGCPGSFGAPARDCGALKHEVFNVASGIDTTVLDILSCLNKITGKNIRPKLLPVRAGDAFKTLADISKIKKVLAFKLKVSFKEGLRPTVDYWKNAAPPALSK